MSSSNHSSASSSSLIIIWTFKLDVNLFWNYNVVCFLNLFADRFAIERSSEITVERYVAFSFDWRSSEIFNDVDQVLPYVIEVMLISLYLDREIFVRGY